MRSYLQFGVLFLFVASAFQGYAQEKADKARIVIRKTEGGTTEEIRKEVEIKDEADLQIILEELGVFNEFDGLESGETIEVDVRRFKDGDWRQEVEVMFSGNMKGKPFLGVMLKGAEDGTEGVVITEIIEGTAADASDLKAGDVITEVDGEAVSNVEELVRLIRNKEIGEKVEIRYLRDGKKQKAKIELGERPAEELSFFPKNFQIDPEFEFEIFGDDSVFILREMDMEFAPKPGEEMVWIMGESKAYLGVSPDQDSAEGMVIGKVYEGSAASEMGLQAGDRILSINGNDIADFDALAETISSMEPGQEVSIAVDRSGQSLTLNGTLGEREGGMSHGMRFFNDFKGMDENGDYIFDFELNMDEEEMELREIELEQLQELLRAKRELMEEREMELENRREASMRRIEILIELDNVSEEEAAKINETAEVKLRTENDLDMSRFSFFPNPSTGAFNLSFELPAKGDLQVMVYDKSGNLVYNENRSQFSGAYSNVIDLANLADGMYFLQVLQNGKSYSKKLIKGE